MGFFSREPQETLTNEQKEAGITPSDSEYLRGLKMKVHKGDKLTESEVRTLSGAGIEVAGSEQAWESAQTGKVPEVVDPKAPHCPKCESRNIQFLGNKKKGFSVGKAVGGAILTAGSVGTLAGFAGKKGKDQWICMDCGNKFNLK